MNLQTIFPITIATFDIQSVHDSYNNIENFLYDQDYVDLNDRGGYSVDQDILNAEILKPVKEEIEKCINAYKLNLGHDVQDIKIATSWCNILETGNSLDIHSHANSYISGVLHFTEGSDLVFHEPETKSLFGLETYYNATEYRIPAKIGQVVLFPSLLKHNVASNEDIKHRLSIAFNTWPLVYGTETSKVNLKEI